MTIASSQPSVRFSKAGPYGIEGVSWVPKVITIEKEWSTDTENDDFWLMPAGSFISKVVAVCSDAADTNTLVSVGLDGADHQFITETAFTVQTVGNYAVYNTGYYNTAADYMRIAVAGTPAAGAAQIMVEYFELAGMFASAHHFDE